MMLPNNLFIRYMKNKQKAHECPVSYVFSLLFERYESNEIPKILT